MTDRWAGLHRLRGKLTPERLRNSVVLIDTGLTAVAGVLLVVGAARSLDSRELAAFALAQLATVTTVGVVRASVYGPALATQRTTGQAKIPATWILRIALPAAVVLTGIVGPLVTRAGGQLLPWLSTLLITGGLVLTQDCLRSALLSRKATRGALASDGVSLSIIVLGIVFSLFPASAIGIMLFWAVGQSAAALVAFVAIFLGRHAAREIPSQTLRHTWRIGKWAALDSTFAAVAALLPMFVATLYVGNASAGTYRTLQSAVGPLNILHTTVVTVFGLDAWRTASLDGVRNLQRTVRRLATAMVAGSALYVAVAVPVMIWITGLGGTDLGRIGAIVAIAAILGASTTPFNAASLSMGYQRFGALIRFVVVAASIVISLPIADSRWLPWQDPIGTAMLFAALTTLIGWFASYRYAVRRERKALEDEPRSGA